MRSVFTHYPIFIRCLLSLLGAFTQAIIAQPATNILDEGCFITEDGTIERIEMVRFKKQLHSNKDSTLFAIRTESFNDLIAHSDIGTTGYMYSSYYRYMRIGNLFSANKKHAVVIYLSDAFKSGDDDFRVDLHVFEITDNDIRQVFQASNLSSYYREVAADITDLDGNGSNELLVLTSEAEWGSATKPANEYYHLFLYDWATDTFIPYKGFEQLPNPIFLNTNYLYTYQTCGCGGDCWVSTLYQQDNKQLYPIATLEDRCVGVGKLFAIGNDTKTLIAETIATDGRAAIAVFWQRYMSDMAAK